MQNNGNVSFSNQFNQMSSVNTSNFNQQQQPILHNQQQQIQNFSANNFAINNSQQQHAKLQLNSSIQQAKNERSLSIQDSFDQTDFELQLLNSNNKVLNTASTSASLVSALPNTSLL